MTDRELLEIIASQVSKLTNVVDEIKATMATKDKFTEIKSEVNSIKAIVIKVENDHGQKLRALLDGYKHNSEKLDRIEAIVTKHEEFISGRLK